LPHDLTKSCVLTLQAHMLGQGSISWVLALCLVYAGRVLCYTMPDTGYATMTHYGLPIDAIAACGCTAESTHYPTAALSSLAYGSTEAFGPGCGRCFKLQLINTFLSDPIWYPNSKNSIVIKVTDECPSGPPWCNATDSQPNAAGAWVNFDLAYPSPAIPPDFYPTNISYYGYDDFGVWNISYTSVPCENNWAGFQDQAALGSPASLGPEGVCCPADPNTYPNTTCPSYSAHNGNAPNTTTNGSHRLTVPLASPSPFSPLIAAIILFVVGAIIHAVRI